MGLRGGRRRAVTEVNFLFAVVVIVVVFIFAAIPVETHRPGL